MERFVRRPYPAVDPNERAIALSTTIFISLQEKSTLNEIEREKLMC